MVPCETHQVIGDLPSPAVHAGPVQGRGVPLPPGWFQSSTS